jgi:hypothetical protein
MRLQRDPLGCNHFEQLMNGGEGVACSNGHEDVITFEGVQVSLDGVDERPGQVGSSHNQQRHHRTLVLHLRAAPGLYPSREA